MPGIGSGAYRLARCLAGVGLVSLLFSGCAAERSAALAGRDLDAQDPAREFPRIESVAVQGSRLLIGYREEDRRYHAAATLQPLAGELLSKPDGSLPVRTLWPITDENREGVDADGAAVVVRGPGAWRALLNSSLQVLAPRTDGYGACVDILHRKELFVYRGENGVLVSVPMAFKPAEIEVAGSYRFSGLLAVMLQELRKDDAAGGRFLFETADDSEYGYPFVYADTRAGQILFLRRESWSYSHAGTLPWFTPLEVVTQTVIDHIQAFFNQPVSSMTRLFTMVSSSTFDLLRPTPLALIERGPIPPAGNAAGMDLGEWERELDEITDTASSSGRLVFLIDGVEFFPRLIDVVSSATASVYLRVYIFDNDDYATGIADLLKRRSAQIDVRVLVDGLGTLGAKLGHSASLPPGYEPASSITRYLERDSGVRVREVANVWLSGDHTKTLVVDDRIAFLGGMNIGREYRYDWHDMMVEIEGPVVSAISEEFLRAWGAAGLLGDLQKLFFHGRVAPVPAGPADYPLRLLYTRPGDSQILRAQIAAMREARRYIYLQNPYITSDAILYELVKARRRGVDVRVIMPYRGDSGVINRSNVLAANAMLRNGIRVYIYPGMSHLKAAVYDGWACLGSANMDKLSLRTNREMNLATSHAPAVDALLERVFRADLDKSVELTGPLPHNWSDYLAELLADHL
jgi:cardiolipin synthase